MAEFMAIALFISICLALMSGYPVAFTLGGMALLFAGIGVVTGSFDVGRDAEPLAHMRACPYQCFIPFQAGQRGAIAGEIASEMALAGTPVQPVRRRFGEP